FSPWLCHSDARQVSDLPRIGPCSSHGLRPCVGGHRPPVLVESLPASRRLAAHRGGRAMARTTFRLLPSAFCLLASAFCLLLSAFCLLLSAFCFYFPSTVNAKSRLPGCPTMRP